MHLAEGISVVICCYDSAQRLGPTLQHLADQVFNQQIPWEIILVDNASSDQTAAAADCIWRGIASPVPMRLIYEAQPGTDNARRAGIYAARYRYFVFCDDDNWLAGNYLQTAFDFLETHKNVGIVGGQAIPVADDELPVWFSNYAGYYAACAPASASCDMSHWGLWAAGMAGKTQLVRTALQTKIPLLNAGRVGNSLSFGEDGEICMRVALQGYRIIYSSELKFKHYITHQRLTESYRNALLQQANKPAEVMATYHRMLRWAYEPSWKKFIIAIVHLGKYMLFRLVGDRSKLSFSKDYLYFKTRWKIFQTGCNKAVWLYFNNLKDMSIEDERILKEI